MGAAAVIDTFNVLYLTGGILLCLKKVKGKDTNPDSAFCMRQAHSPTFGDKTANICVEKTYQFTTVCKDDVMISVF